MMVPRGGRAVCPRCGSVDDTAAISPLFVVTGASGSGKTAVLGPLARRLAGRCVTFDVDWLLDSAGRLADGQPLPWPAFRDAWLAVAHGVAQCGMPTVLLGPFLPDQLEPLPARRWVGAVHFLALDCPDDLRRARIRARPSWRGHDGEGQVEFGRWLRRNVTDLVDTSIGGPEDTAAAVAAWVTSHLVRPAAQQRGDRDGRGGGDPGGDEQGEVHSVRESGVRLGGDGSAQMGGDGDR